MEISNSENSTSLCPWWEYRDIASCIVFYLETLQEWKFFKRVCKQFYNLSRSNKWYKDALINLKTCLTKKAREQNLIASNSTFTLSKDYKYFQNVNDARYHMVSESVDRCSFPIPFQPISTVKLSDCELDTSVEIVFGLSAIGDCVISFTTKFPFKSCKIQFGNDSFWLVGNGKPDEKIYFISEYFNLPIASIGWWNTHKTKLIFVCEEQPTDSRITVEYLCISVEFRHELTKFHCLPFNGTTLAIDSGLVLTNYFPNAN
jgi:hypothetical protein